MMEGNTALVLNERLCACGCGCSFRCLTGSSAKFSSVTHDPDYDYSELFHQNSARSGRKKQDALREEFHGMEPESLYGPSAIPGNSDDEVMLELKSRRIGGDGEPSVSSALQIELED